MNGTPERTGSLFWCSLRGNTLDGKTLDAARATGNGQRQDEAVHRIEPPGGEFTTIASGYHHTCGVRTDGTIACWGDNWAGQSDPPSGAFTQVGTGHDHSCGLRTDGTIACWGYDRKYGATRAPTGEFAALSVGARHSCGLKADGSMICWGRRTVSAPDGVDFRAG